MPRKNDKKIQKTIERMKKIRQKDTIYLRNLIEEKLKWVREEKEKLSDIIKNLEKQLDSYNKLMLKLEGAEITLCDLLGKEQDEVWHKKIES